MEAFVLNDLKRRIWAAGLTSTTGGAGSASCSMLGIGPAGESAYIHQQGYTD